jgi:hypothetical protein
MSPSGTSPKAGGSRPQIVMTLHAEQMLKARGVAMSDILTTLSSGSYSVDSKTGHEVFRPGDLRIVVKREGNRIAVLTAVRAGDFAEDAG